MKWNFRYLVVTLVVAVPLTVLSQQGAKADPISDLDKAFRDAYGLATSQTFLTLRAKGPVLVNRFGQIALYRPGIENPEIFSMDMRLYLETRAIAHTGVALYARLAPFGFGKLDPDRLAWLNGYAALLSKAEANLESRTDIPPDLKSTQLKMLATCRRTIQSMIQQGEIEIGTLKALAADIRPGIDINLEAAAGSQLEQFRSQVNKWKSTYTDLNWSNAVVVILGIHQARENYLQRQFFDWLLHDNPDSQEHVIFAETMSLPRPLEVDPAPQAIELLSKVMLDKEISAAIFNDPLRMQSDVLGNAAASIIEGWPSP